MSIYYEKNNTTTGYKPVGSYKKIYYTNNGNPYFMRGGRREKLENIPRLSYPIMPEDENGRLIVIGGYMPLGYNALLVELHPDGEYIRLWEEVDISA